MKERHLISQNLIDNRMGGAVLINQDESISVMVNEEDVIREQCFMKGLKLTEAFKRLDKIDDDLDKNLNLAYDCELGYLTACPTNLGTGLRASVLLFLPALTESGKIKALLKEVEKIGLTVRGAYGEGSVGEGFMYQISNEVTLGVSEEEIINTVEETVLNICALERKETERLFGKNELKIIDRVRKSFGILTNAVLLDYKEFLSHVSLVKMGAMLGMIDISDLEGIDDLILAVRPAVLCQQYDRKLSEIDRDLFRAEIVSKKLLKLRG
jgi:protein arginine kinase